MKATIEFDDELYRQLKATAALRGSKVKELVAEGVRMVLRQPELRGGLRRLKLPMVKSRKPGTLKLTNEMIAEHALAGWMSQPGWKKSGSPRPL